MQFYCIKQEWQKFKLVFNTTFDSLHSNNFSKLCFNFSRQHRDRSFFRKPFFRKFVGTPPPTRGVRGWRNRLRGLVYPVRLGQVRNAIKISIIQNTKAPIHSLDCFGRKFERTVFERTTSSRQHLLEPRSMLSCS